MSNIQLEEQKAKPIDEATKIALEQARAEIGRGEVMTLAQARIAVEKQHQVWRKAEREVLAA